MRMDVAHPEEIEAAARPGSLEPLHREFLIADFHPVDVFRIWLQVGNLGLVFVVSDIGTTEGNRTIKDSYWRCLGVPSFNIYNTPLTDGSGNPITWQPDGNTLPFIYAWNKADNTLTAQSTSTFTFLPMHAYLVQNGGEIRWTNVSAKPASPIVARRVNEQPATEYEWRLALTSDSVLIDQTYVKMSNIEQVTDTFDFNQDMIKEFNAYRSDIYTYIGYERVAANSMPLQTEQTTVIPVGVKIKTAGDYTFAMPDGTNGVGVTWIIR